MTFDRAEVQEKGGVFRCGSGACFAGSVMIVRKLQASG